LDSTVLPAGLARFGHLEDSRGCCQTSRNGGPFTDRCWRRGSHRSLTRPQHSKHTPEELGPRMHQCGDRAAFHTIRTPQSGAHHAACTTPMRALTCHEATPETIRSRTWEIKHCTLRSVTDRIRPLPMNV